MKKVLCLLMILVMFLPMTASAGGEKTKIVFWDSGAGEFYEPATQKIVDAYNATNTMNVEVEVQFIGNSYYEVLQTAVAAGEGPDVTCGWSPTALQYAAAGLALPLDDTIEQWKAEGHEMWTDIPEEYYDFYVYEDHYYAIPYMIGPKVITYRKDMFEEAGIAELPVTFDDFLDACRKLKATFPDKIPFLIAGANFMGTHAAIGFGVYNGTGFVTPDLEPNLTSKEFQEVLEFFRVLREEELISPGSAAYGASDVERLFASGEGAMVFQSIPSFVRGSDVFDKSGVMPPLQGPSGSKQQTYAWINGAFCFNTTEHPEEAVDFLIYWTQNIKPVYSEGNVVAMPARISLQNDPDIARDWVFQETAAAMAYGCVTNAYPAPNLYPEFAQIEGEDIAGSALTEVMAGGTDLVGIARKYDQRIADCFE